VLDQRIFGVCSLLSALASRSPGGISPIALVAMTSLRQRVLHRCGRKGTHARTHYESAPLGQAGRRVLGYNNMFDQTPSSGNGFSTVGKQ